MLIQITNRCRMGCPHCMENSTPDGGMMTGETFSNIVRFAVDNGEVHVVLSGGEPTEHKDFVEFCKETSKAGLRFSVCTNGMWLGDEKAEYRFEKVAKLGGFVGAQIYSNPKWYRLHDETLAKFAKSADRWKSLGVNLDTEEISSMQDIGRAKDNELAIAETMASRYHNACLTSCVTAAQTDSLREFFSMMLRQGRFCTPQIDFNGNLHMSESWLCPSVGNVNTDTYDEIWEGMRRFRPCGGCIPCKRYLTENSPKMVAVRRLLGQ